MNTIIFTLTEKFSFAQQEAGAPSVFPQADLSELVRVVLPFRVGPTDYTTLTFVRFDEREKFWSEFNALHAQFPAGFKLNTLTL